VLPNPNIPESIFIYIFLKIYKLATPNRYDFLYLDLQQNPPLAYHNFEKLIARGGEIINENNND
jgi:hypothetical protein